MRDDFMDTVTERVSLMRVLVDMKRSMIEKGEIEPDEGINFDTFSRADTDYYRGVLNEFRRAIVGEGENALMTKFAAEDGKLHRIEFRDERGEPVADPEMLELQTKWNALLDKARMFGVPVVDTPRAGEIDAETIGTMERERRGHRVPSDQAAGVAGGEADRSDGPEPNQDAHVRDHRGQHP